MLKSNHVIFQHINLEKGYVDFPYSYRIIIVEDSGFMIMDLERM